MPSAFDGEKKPVCIHGSTCKACWEGHNSQQHTAAVSAGEPKSISTCYWQPGAGPSDHRMSHDSENTSAAPLFPPVQRLIARPSSSGIRAEGRLLAGPGHDCDFVSLTGPGTHRQMGPRPIPPTQENVLLKFDQSRRLITD